MGWRIVIEQKGYFFPCRKITTKNIYLFDGEIEMLNRNEVYPPDRIPSGVPVELPITAYAFFEIINQTLPAINWN